MTVWAVLAEESDERDEEALRNVYWIHEIHGTAASAERAKEEAQKDYDEQGFCWTFFVESYPVIVEEEQ